MTSSSGWYDVCAFGAVGDGKASDGPAIQKAIDACSSAGGGTVFLPGGKTFLAGSLTLKSNVCFRVDRGARLLASTCMADYHWPAFEGQNANDETRAWICADGAENLRITGGGEIDGRSPDFVLESLPHINRVVPWRPVMLVLVRCRRLRIDDIVLRHPANWATNLECCDDVILSRVSVLGDLKQPNNDGLHPHHCRNVRISDCLVQCGDDAIVVSSNPKHVRDFGPCENIQITNCTLVSTSSAFKIGSGTSGHIRDITMSNCVVRGSNRGLAIMARDEGIVENLLFSDIIVETRYFHPDWWGNGEPIYVTALPRTPETGAVVVRNVRFRNILCRSENGIVIHGHPTCRIEDVDFEGVRVDVTRRTKWDGGRLDVRPCPPESTFGYAPDKGIGTHTPWGQVVRAETPGVFVYEGHGIRFNRCELRLAPGLPACSTKACAVHQSEGVDLSGLRTLSVSA
jgi:hypothetical protein